MTTNIENFAISYKAQGVTGVLDLAELHMDTVKACLMYGIRRKLQDTINSAAKSARDNNEPYNAEAEVAALVAHMKAGTIPARASGGVDPVERVMFQLARTDWLATLPTDKRKEARGLEVGAIKAAMSAIIEKNPDGYRERAESEIARRAKEAQARAEAIASAMNAVTAAEIDLDALLKSSAG